MKVKENYHVSYFAKQISKMIQNPKRLARAESDSRGEHWLGKQIIRSLASIYGPQRSL